MAKHLLFSYYVRAAFCSGYDYNCKYRLWSNGAFEEIEMDRDKEADFVGLIFKDEEVSKRVEEILEQYQEKIDAMPINLSNSSVYDGAYQEIQFKKKKISGFNMTVQFSKEDPLYRHGKNMNVIFNKLKKIPSLRKFIS